MSRISLIISLFVCVLFINACGQSGDLYLPTGETQAEVESQDEEIQEEESKE
ncbi:MAG: lipoprotein [Pseudomonadota bacterium]